MNLDWKHWTVIALLLGALGAWGSRERVYTKTIDEAKKSLIKVSDDLSRVTTEANAFKRNTEMVSTRTPILMPDGKTVAYVMRVEKRTVESAMRTVTDQMTQYRSQIASLESKLASKESEVTKSAPLWAVAAEVPLMNSGDFSKWRLGAGVNFGSLTLAVMNPLALTLEPHLLVQMRL